MLVSRRPNRYEGHCSPSAHLQSIQSALQKPAPELGVAINQPDAEHLLCNNHNHLHIGRGDHQIARIRWALTGISSHHLQGISDIITCAVAELLFP